MDEDGKTVNEKHVNGWIMDRVRRALKEKKIETAARLCAIAHPSAKSRLERGFRSISPTTRYTHLQALGVHKRTTRASETFSQGLLKKGKNLLEPCTFCLPFLDEEFYPYL